MVDGTGGGDNYYTINSLDFNDNTLTIKGGSNDYFIFNVLGDFTFAKSQIVLDGVLPEHIVFNFPGCTQTQTLRACP